MNYKDSLEHQRTQQKADAWRNAGMDIGAAGIGCFTQIAIAIGGLFALGVIVALLDVIFHFI